MTKLSRDELLKELNDLQEKGAQFFDKVDKDLEKCAFHQLYGMPIPRDEFWKNLHDATQSMANSLISRVIKIAPVIAESVRMTSYLTQTDQVDLGHAIKGMRSALRLCRYKHWAPDVIHDEGMVLGIQPGGQSDNEGIFPDDAKRIFEDCLQRTAGVVELINPVIVERAEQNIEERGQISGFKPDTAFIMMWMDPKRPELEDVSNTVKRCFEEFNITAECAADIQHEGLITEKIIDKIKSSEFLFADLTGARPNVYYEVGFAHAIRRRVILYRKSGEKLHFDLAGYNCPEYENLSDLEKKLLNRLSHMTGRKIEKGTTS